MRSYRILATDVDLDGLPLRAEYADVFVVLRDGSDEVAPTDWECTLRTDQFETVAPARHDLALSIADGTTIRGAAIVRFSDGHRHLFRGDSLLEGFDPEPTVDG